LWGGWSRGLGRYACMLVSLFDVTRRGGKCRGLGGNASRSIGSCLFRRYQGGRGCFERKKGGAVRFVWGMGGGSRVKSEGGAQGGGGGKRCFWGVCRLVGWRGVLSLGWGGQKGSSGFATQWGRKQKIRKGSYSFDTLSSQKKEKGGLG